MRFIKPNPVRLWLGLVAVVATVIVLSNPTEPRVQGKRVSDWLDEIPYGGNAPGVSVPRNEPAFAALVNGGPEIAETLANIWLAGHHDSRTARLGDRWSSFIGRNKGTRSRANRGWCAWEILTEMGPTASNAAPTFIDSLKDSSKTQRIEAMFALGRIGVLPEESVPAIMPGLDDPDPVIVFVAARSLGFFGNEARPALPQLETLKTNTSLLGYVRIAATAAICRIDAGQSEARMDELIAELRRPPGERIERTPSVLGDMGADARRAIPALIDMIDQGVEGEIATQPELAAWKALKMIDSEAYEAEYVKRGGDAIDRQWNRNPPQDSTAADAHE